jgi:hypothetical protein
MLQRKISACVAVAVLVLEIMIFAVANVIDKTRNH